MSQRFLLVLLMLLAAWTFQVMGNTNSNGKIPKGKAWGWWKNKHRSQDIEPESNFWKNLGQDMPYCQYWGDALVRSYNKRFLSPDYFMLDTIGTQPVPQGWYYMLRAQGDPTLATDNSDVFRAFMHVSLNGERQRAVKADAGEFCVAQTVTEQPSTDGMAIVYKVEGGGFYVLKVSLQDGQLHASAALYPSEGAEPTCTKQKTYTAEDFEQVQSFTDILSNGFYANKETEFVNYLTGRPQYDLSCAGGPTFVPYFLSNDETGSKAVTFYQVSDGKIVRQLDASTNGDSYIIREREMPIIDRIYGMCALEQIHSFNDLRETCEEYEQRELFSDGSTIKSFHMLYYLNDSALPPFEPPEGFPNVTSGVYERVDLSRRLLQTSQGSEQEGFVFDNAEQLIEIVTECERVMYATTFSNEERQKAFDTCVQLLVNSPPEQYEAKARSAFLADDSSVVSESAREPRTPRGWMSTAIGLSAGAGIAALCVGLLVWRNKKLQAQNVQLERQLHQRLAGSGGLDVY